ncbi:MULTISPECIES: DUF5946 family protein [unclassified Roseovarius]|uniref:DUF5946 family protein n=1 Tax=unclassified Roseovarius TaxID=2614913 RepID=UPI00273F4F82|nr:DUF5946 family protein [Roseovarius sp. MMSF_3350]
MSRHTDTSRCAGCGAVLRDSDGPVHAYMTSSPACFERFNRILAPEYSQPSLRDTHRLTVDTYAVQHPGEGSDRRRIQSVGLHLARLCLQLADPRPPRETNDVMLGLSKYKETLKQLQPPARFTVTAADVAPFAGSAHHAGKVRDWAAATWNDWAGHHAYIREWIAERRGDLKPRAKRLPSTRRKN